MSDIFPGFSSHKKM